MTETATPSILKRLRLLAPARELSFADALAVAELQASRLIQLVDSEDGIRHTDIAALPRVAVVYEVLTVSGMSHWNGKLWLVTINQGDSLAQQRFTLLHEFKHIVDHGHTHRLYRGDRHCNAARQAEVAADYFAGCALVPKRLLKSAWGNGIQRVSDLATHFEVSEPAIRVRLSQTGLDVPVDGYASGPPCGPRPSSPRNQPLWFRIRRSCYPRRMYV